MFKTIIPRRSAVKEDKRPAAVDLYQADLDNFVKPKPSKKARFAKPLSDMQMADLEKGPTVPNTE